ncbi:efflux RND transporter periplasmic adaptor subunit [Mucilaginibacter gynuensis]|uniref:Efflux RND transporter periplasmic adaptor subunit n=1 Tax=Mucilaginibacter gynuensis TaxID=1302236 RepID=A0ABP8G656_9SPHI
MLQVQSGSGITYNDYPASIEGKENLEIRPQVSGILTNIFVDEGAFVTKGQPIFKIDQAPFLEKLNNARALLRSAHGALANAQLEIEKLTPLVAGKVVSEYQLRTAQQAKETAQGNVDQANAAIASEKINLGYTLIKAPCNGYIGRLLKKQGSLVGPNDPAALTDLSDVEQVRVYFAFGETDFIQFKKQYGGTTIAEKVKRVPPVQLILADDSIYSVRGKIDLFDGQFDKNTSAITIRATFQNTNGLLRSGNTGKIRMGIGYAGKVIIPQSATGEMQDKIFVYVIQPDNKVQKRLITIFGKTGESYLVKDGLKAGERIVTKGFDHLQDGDTVKPELVSNTAQRLVKNN